ncbi:head-tail connector protein [Mycobacterium phage Severus]|uniref:head-tail connector protein n=1 Tax=Mycobacterium phage Severus TaxID=1327776 RepID=UPI00032B728B|nr:head-tail connector protein [Mycobacterium phage Severus]AVO22416.1 hypothetical protein SEA_KITTENMITTENS_15 [Mycobacterium phage KittenMittens]QWS69299.1 hypothetical protein SEA_PEACEMEAL1_15 [Mycobacterium Phage PeaceMeal1]QZD96999.1 hypothetical protein SEA_DRAKE94_15 [Mycobacterium phage Drake94]USL89149.1 hypothetical protein SEA_POOMPHA_15 [Mycobacterium phage Poompha]AGK87947.1 hypothetical protein PBI_SEVERUS_15 [Mycobacterium phage Severus]
MKIRHKTNGGEADVTEDYAQSLIATGYWEPADAPRRRRRQSTPKTQTNETTEEVSNDGE